MLLREFFNLIYKVAVEEANSIGLRESDYRCYLNHQECSGLLG